MTARRSAQRPSPRSHRPHLPIRPIWLSRACGHPWPCGASLLALLIEYAGDRAALLVYLARLQEEATAHLTELTPDRPPKGLTERFVSWARARG